MHQIKFLTIVFLSLFLSATISHDVHKLHGNHDRDISECQHKCFHLAEKCGEECDKNCKVSDNPHCMDHCIMDCIGVWLRCANECNDEEYKSG